MNSDTYKTIASAAEGLYKDKGSKFFAYVFPVTDEQEIKAITARLKKEHHSARHHCFAWRLGADHLQFRINDDGEPSGTAGRPLLGQIQQRELTNILIVVVRYFGGILLGTSGLINAYKQAAADALNHSEQIEKVVEILFEVNFDYCAMNNFMSLLKEYHLEMQQNSFDLTCKALIRVRKQIAQEIKKKLDDIDHLKYQIIVDN